MVIKRIIKISVLTFFAVSVAVGAVEIEDVKFGFGEGYRIGTWAPLTVTVWNQDEGTVFRGELVVEVRNFSSDIPIERYATSLHLIGLERQQKNFYVYCPKNATQLVIRLVPFRTLGDDRGTQDSIRSSEGCPVANTPCPQRLFRAGIGSERRHVKRVC